MRYHHIQNHHHMFERELEREMLSFCAARGHTLAELAHAWLLAHPEVSSVISGATGAAQLQANARSAD